MFSIKWSVLKYLTASVVTSHICKPYTLGSLKTINVQNIYFWFTADQPRAFDSASHTKFCLDRYWTPTMKVLRNKKFKQKITANFVPSVWFVVCLLYKDWVVWGVFSTSLAKGLLENCIEHHGGQMNKINYHTFFLLTVLSLEKEAKMWLLYAVSC